MIYAKGTTLTHKNGSTMVADGSTNFSDSAWSVSGGSTPVVAPVAPTVKAPVVAPVIPKTTQTSTPTVSASPADSQGQITALQTHLADLTAQQNALTQYGVDDTNLLTKDATTGKYYLNTGGGKTSTVGGTGTTGTETGTTDSGTSGLAAIQAFLDKMAQQSTDYQTALTNQPTAEAQLAKYRDLLGLPQQEAEYATAKKDVTGTQQLISDTEDMITKLEGDLNERISGTLTTEGTRRRLLAGEQKPLAEQLSGYSTLLGKQQTTAGMEQQDVTGLQSQLADMLNLSSQDQASALAAAKAPLDFSASILPTIESMAEYQSPQQKLADQIAQESAMKAGGYGTYAPSKTTSEPQILGSATTGYYKYDPATDTTKKIIGGETPTPISPKKEATDYSSALYNVGIPTKVATTEGKMNKSYLDKLTTQGIPVDLAQSVWDAILNGTTLEEIRQALKTQGVDPKILDTYMMTLQGISASSTGGGRNP